VPRDEVEAAYFALLRAREELDGLRRYDDYLREERARLRRFDAEGAALADAVDRRYRRVLAHTDQPLADALRSRRAVIDDELARLPERLEAAEAFVADCEREHAELRRSA
jgi:hypothetical protein